MLTLLFLTLGIFTATLLWSICAQAKRADEIAYRMQMEKLKNYGCN